jgi:hypothetical protein
MKKPRAFGMSPTNLKGYRLSIISESMVMSLISAVIIGPISVILNNANGPAALTIFLVLQTLVTTLCMLHSIKNHKKWAAENAAEARDREKQFDHWATLPEEKRGCAKTLEWVVFYINNDEGFSQKEVLRLPTTLVSN